MSNIHLVLSGAGARFPVFIGALKAVEERGVRVRQLVGTSGGALVGAFYKAGVPIAEMERLALEIDFTRFASFGLTKVLAFALRGWLNPAKPVIDFVDQQLGGKTFRDVPDFAAVVTDLSREQTIICHSATTPCLPVAAGVYASGAIPLVFQQCGPASRVWVDGSVRYDFALDWPHLRDGTPTIGIKLQSAYTAPHSTSPAEMIRATITNMIDAADRKHIEDASHARYIDIPVDVGALQFRLSRAEKQRLIQLGYETTRTALPAMIEAAQRHTDGEDHAEAEAAA